MLEGWRPRHTQKLVVDSHERLGLTAPTASFGFWSWDAATDAVWASAQTRAILACDENAPLGRESLLGAIHTADCADLFRAIDASSARSNTAEMELRVFGQAREIRWITAKACAYRDAKGMVVRVVGYVRDNRNCNRASAEILKLQHRLTHLGRVAMLGELSGALAHELQQPLTAILCNAQAAQTLTANAQLNIPQVSEILQAIVDDGKHAGQIIQRLRALLTRGETQFKEMEIDRVVKDALAVAHGKLKERNVQVKIRIDEGTPVVRGDCVEIQQVLLNLILNACDSMAANPARDRRIEIVIAQEENAVCISVLDCGTGIRSDHLVSVFDAFFTTKEGGMGLGLSISHAIIAAHGGRLWATNRADRGAAFHFTLPIVPREKRNVSSIADSVYC
jgi:two-component system, LuxR family, sensor kinase FixL